MLIVSYEFDWVMVCCGGFCFGVFLGLGICGSGWNEIGWVVWECWVEICVGFGCGDLIICELDGEGDGNCIEFSMG